MRTRLPAAAFLAAALLAMPAAADPTITSLPLTGGGTTYYEATYNDGTHFFTDMLMGGWTGSAWKPLTVDPTTGYLGVNVFSSVLPTGAATSAAQLLGNASLASVAAAEASNVFFAPYTTALAASATYSGASRDVGAAAGTGQPVSYFNSVFYADQAGTAYIDLSDDNTVWTPAVPGQALSANTPLTLTAPLLARYYRARLVNGSTAETNLRVSNAFSRN